MARRSPPSAPSLPTTIVALSALCAVSCAGNTAPPAPAKSAAPQAAVSAVPLATASASPTSELEALDQLMLSGLGGGSRSAPRDPGDLCAVADSNLDRDLAAVLAAGESPAAGAPAAAWDH